MIEYCSMGNFACMRLEAEDWEVYGKCCELYAEYDEDYQVLGDEDYCKDAVDNNQQKHFALFDRERLVGTATLDIETGPAPSIESVMVLSAYAADQYAVDLLYVACCQYVAGSLQLNRIHMDILDADGQEMIDAARNGFFPVSEFKVGDIWYRRCAANLDDLGYKHKADGVSFDF